MTLSVRESSFDFFLHIGRDLIEEGIMTENVIMTVCVCAPKDWKRPD